ncbi:Protein MANBAL [Mizuhopecten yessoensis]|uniref:Protein MANBAL n=1 Tax=Mizuhopecten yessoensis TaxID=6573 RepID=A0A210Q1C1_MIZYE|nr:Protein MANBAL [Mizuhopecten yessoensis]
MAIEIEEPTLFENVLHYGLLLGAVFQLICVFAIIFIPKSELDKDSEEDLKAQHVGQSSGQNQQHGNNTKKNKKEKKKNR